MKVIRLESGTDIFDARTLPTIVPNKDVTITLPSGKVVPKFVFHALSATGSSDPELRGMAVEVTDDEAMELLTIPRVTFSEVSQEQADFDRYAKTLSKDLFGRWRDPRTGDAVDLEALRPKAPQPVPTRTQGKLPAKEPATTS